MGIDLLSKDPASTILYDTKERCAENISLREFRKLVKELEEEQQKKLEKCHKVDGDWRCSECGSSLRQSEVRFRLVDPETKKPNGNILTMLEIWHCINSDCETPPPLFSPVGVIERKGFESVQTNQLSINFNPNQKQEQQ